MASRGVLPSTARGRADRRPILHAWTESHIHTRGKGNRIDKSSSRGRGRAKYATAAEARRDQEAHTAEARGATPLHRSTKVQRSETGLHACSEISLQFIHEHPGLITNDDTSTLTLNLMDYFLFSETNWLPALSYCRLHAACFLMASLVTGQQNTPKQIAQSLGPGTAFVMAMAAPLAADEDSAVAIQHVISVDVDDVEDGYGLLYARRDQLAGLMGEYAGEVANLPEPKGSEGERGEEDEGRGCGGDRGL